MTALIVIGCIIALFIAIGFVRIAVGASFLEEKFAAYAKVAGKRIDLFPRPEPTRPKKAKAKKEKPPKEKKPKEKKEKKPGEQSIIDKLGGIREIIDFALEAIADFFDMVYTDVFYLKFVSAKKDDPADAASIYGYACAAAGIIVPHLENNKNVKKYSVKIDLDFEAEKPLIEGELRVSVSIGRLVRFAFSKGSRVLVTILKNRKKGGAVHGKAGNQYA